MRTSHLMPAGSLVRAASQGPGQLFDGMVVGGTFCAFVTGKKCSAVVVVLCWLADGKWHMKSVQEVDFLAVWSEVCDTFSHFQHRLMLWHMLERCNNTSLSASMAERGNEQIRCPWNAHTYALSEHFTSPTYAEKHIKDLTSRQLENKLPAQIYGNSEHFTNAQKLRWPPSHHINVLCKYFNASAYAGKQ